MAASRVLPRGVGGGQGMSAARSAREAGPASRASHLLRIESDSLAWQRLALGVAQDHGCNM